MRLMTPSIASMEGLKNFATCALYVMAKTLEPAGAGMNGYSLPLQRQIPAFDVAATVIVSRRTKLHELRSGVFREGVLQPFVEALPKLAKI